MLEHNKKELKDFYTGMKKRILPLGVQMRAAVEDTKREFASEATANFVKRMLLLKSGVTIKFRGRLHTQSAEGEAPANKTGVLKDSIKDKRIDQGIQTGYTVFYGGILEDSLGRPNIKLARLDAEKAVNILFDRIAQMLS
jgi:hypothetical protein